MGLYGHDIEFMRENNISLSLEIAKNELDSFILTEGINLKEKLNTIINKISTLIRNFFSFIARKIKEITDKVRKNKEKIENKSEENNINDSSDKDNKEYEESIEVEIANVKLESIPNKLKLDNSLSLFIVQFDNCIKEIKSEKDITENLLSGFSEKLKNVENDIENQRDVFLQNFPYNKASGEFTGKFILVGYDAKTQKECESFKKNNKNKWNMCMEESNKVVEFIRSVQKEEDTYLKIDTMLQRTMRDIDEKINPKLFGLYKDMYKLIALILDSYSKCIAISLKYSGHILDFADKIIKANNFIDENKSRLKPE